MLMVGVDQKVVGGMLTVSENYLKSKRFRTQTNLKYISTATRGSIPIKLLKFAGAMIRIIGLILTDKTDIVHVHMAERGSVFRKGIVIVIAKALGAKTVIHMHAGPIEEWYSRQRLPVRTLTAWIFCQADRMLVLGKNWVPFMERVMGEKNRKKVLVLHNAVHTPSENLYNNEGKNLLFYGMLTKQKGIEDLLDAFSNILDEIPEDICLMLYGDDVEGNVRERIHARSLETRVKYWGWLEKGEREKCFSETILHVLPSYSEGLPMAILETMSYGIPNVSTEVGSISEVVEDSKNGRLIQPGDVSKLSLVMKEMILCPETRKEYSDNAFMKIRNEFSFPVHLRHLISIYEDLLKAE